MKPKHERLLADLLAAVPQVAIADLPGLMGKLEEIRCAALRRLLAPPAGAPADTLLTIAEAAKRLRCSRNHLYRNYRDFDFARHVGNKILFSSAAIDRHIRKG